MPFSKTMLSVNSQAQMLWGQCDSLVGSRLTKIELVMDNYAHKLVLYLQSRHEHTSPD